MKSLVITILLIAIFQESHAQIFAQKKTRRELLLQQIAALKVYTGYLQKGYEIAKNGINTITDIKHGDFDLHTIFFNSYNIVNPAVLKYAKVPAILSYADGIDKTCKEAMINVVNDQNFSQEENEYLKRVLNTLLDKSAQVISELKLITSDNLLEMKDDERIEWIGRMYDDIKDKCVFVQSFSKGAHVLLAQRINNVTEISNSRALNGIK